MAGQSSILLPLKGCATNARPRPDLTSRRRRDGLPLTLEVMAMRRFVLPLIVLVAAPAWGQTPATFKVGTAAASRGQTAFGAIEVPGGRTARRPSAPHT